MAVAGCGLYHSVPTASFFELHVINDTHHRVTLVIPGPNVHDHLAKGEGIFESAWRNDRPGVALVRVVGARTTLGCLKVHYRKGEKQAAARVSAATACTS